jgi:GNAT superfamily N-acetyltransferase
MYCQARSERVRPTGTEIRTARAEDWHAIWPFFHQIVSAGETYAYDRDMDETEAERIWMVSPPGQTVVAVGPDGAVIGSASMYRNRGGPGSHVASASFMVDPEYAGHGAGRALGEHVLDWARRSGYRAVQFNAVVETNQPAVNLWRSLGFAVLATVPEAFHHPTRGYVGLLIMHRFV